jgi:hypothetical protein
LYSQAEQNYFKNDYLNAALGLSAAFELMKEQEIPCHAGSLIFPKRLGTALVFDSSNDNTIKILSEYALAIEGEVEILKLGVDYKGFRKYSDFLEIHPFDSVGLSEYEDADSIIEYMNKKFTERLTTVSLDLKEWAAFALNFVIESILRWQAITRADYNLKITEDVLNDMLKTKPPDGTQNQLP